MVPQDAPDPGELPNALDGQGRKTGPWAERDSHGGFTTGEWTVFNPDGTVKKVANHEPR